jgi:predicted enzyme related to lactoylglutathione lyase
MAKIESHPPGSFCWAELATNDVAGAKAFYTGMFGWTADEMPITGGVYVMLESDGENVGALYDAQDGQPPHWNIYYTVTNVDEAAKKIASLGGKVVMPPFDVMEAGRMAVAQDPTGAFFCLWQGKQHMGATHGGPFNNFCWTECATPDPAGAIAFYTALFGWTTKPDSGFDTAQYIELMLNGKPFGGVMPMRGDMWKGIPPHWMAYVSVTDCDDRAGKAKELGGSVKVPPTDIPNAGRFAVLTDPQGAHFSIIKLTGMYQPAAA